MNPHGYGEQPPDPRAGRFDGLQAALRIVQVGVAVLALLVVVLPEGTTMTAIGAVMLVILAASAPARVGWLAQRWLRRGDRHYGVLASVLFLLPLLGGIITVML